MVKYIHTENTRLYTLVTILLTMLIKTLSQGFTTLLPHCNNLGIGTVTRLRQPCHKAVPKHKTNSIYGMAEVWWVVSSEMRHHT